MKIKKILAMPLMVSVLATGFANMSTAGVDTDQWPTVNTGRIGAIDFQVREVSVQDERLTKNSFCKYAAYMVLGVMKSTFTRMIGASRGENKGWEWEAADHFKKATEEQLYNLLEKGDTLLKNLELDNLYEITQEQAERSVIDFSDALSDAIGFDVTQRGIAIENFCRCLMRMELPDGSQPLLRWLNPINGKDFVESMAILKRVMANETEVCNVASLNIGELFDCGVPIKLPTGIVLNKNSRQDCRIMEFILENYAKISSSYPSKRPDPRIVPGVREKDVILREIATAINADIERYLPYPYMCKINHNSVDILKRLAYDHMMIDNRPINKLEIEHYITPQGIEIPDGVRLKSDVELFVCLINKRSVGDFCEMLKSVPAAQLNSLRTAIQQVSPHSSPLASVSSSIPGVVDRR